MSRKVLHLIDSGGLYGAEKMLLALTAEQVAQGLDPLILSVGVPGEGKKQLELEAERLGLPLKIWRMKPGLNFRGIIKILSWADTDKFNLVHSHGYKFNILLGLLPRSIRKKICISTVHGNVYSKKFSKIWLYQLLDRYALSRLDHIVLVGEGTRRQLASHVSLTEKVSVIHNGLDIETINEETSHQVEQNILTFMDSCRPLIISVGRLAPEKGFDRLIQAFSKLKSARPEAGLIIVGTGALESSLRELTRELCVNESVLLPGYCATVPALLKQADVLVMPSLTEGLPITLLEAMAIRTPVIASAVGEIPAVLEFGKGGTILNNPSPEAIYVALEKVLSNDPKILTSVDWSEGAVKDRYTSKAMAENYRLLYGRLIPY